MTPSVKKLLEQHLNKEAVTEILALLKRYEIDLGVGKDSVFARDVLQYCDFDTSSVESFLALHREFPNQQLKRLAVFREIRCLAESYRKERFGYYQSFGEALIKAAPYINLRNFTIGTSMNVLCICERGEKEFNPIGFVVPLTDGTMFLTNHPGVNGMHKMPTLALEVGGEIVVGQKLAEKLNSFLESTEKNLTKHSI